MTVDEAIYCMKSYLPDNDLENCLTCPYYGSVRIEDNVSVCRSSEAHELAIKALIKMKEAM